MVSFFAIIRPGRQNRLACMHMPQICKAEYSVQFSDMHYASSSMTLKDEREGDMAGVGGRRVWLSRSSKDIASKFKMAGSTNLRRRLLWTGLGYNSDMKTSLEILSSPVSI